ncbi:MAG: DNA topoisomerase IV subunit A [Candidatus Aenigmatarchaeota archaeon]|nr:DNA topoisomerase IV subunit A [Candidatus Aenigmarchaeota archaeon]
MSIEVLKKLGKKLINDIQKNENPSLDVPIRTLSNITYDPKTKLIKLGNKTAKRYLFNVAHIKKFVQTIETAAISKELIEVNKHLNLREVYYKMRRTIPDTNINIVDEQEETNKAIEDLELITGLSREQLHFNADRNGFAAGNIIIKDRGHIIDWSKMGSGGWAIPSNVEEIEFKKVDAKFIIYIEKAATWERLNEDRVWEKLNCVIICSKGQATRGIRRLLQRLNLEHNLPVYVLVDLDPWGIYIYSVLKFGSISLAHISESLTIPGAKYLGLTPDDVEKYGLKRHIEKYKDVDLKRLEEVSNYEWFKHDKRWQLFFSKMRELKGKVEIAALTERGISFISDSYLVEKIKNKDWIE